MPQGFLQPDEARLDDHNGFLTPEQVENVVTWWLAVRQNANTPNWDVVSKCTVGGHPGLILLEAKAHADELNPHDCCAAGNELNRQRIVEAIKGASTALGQGWSLTADGRYQLSNRFAWAWKIASLGVPVVLICLGFLDAQEMDHPFDNHAAWERCLHQYADSFVPRTAWNSKIMVNGTPLIPLIRSANVNVTAT